MTRVVKKVLVIQKDRREHIATMFSPREGFENMVFTSKTNNSLNASYFQ